MAKEDIVKLNLNYWNNKHSWGHIPTLVNPSGYEPDCPYCNPEVMKSLKGE